MTEDWDHEAEVGKLIARAREAGESYLKENNTNAVEVMYFNRALRRALGVLRPYIVVPPPPAEPKWWQKGISWMNRMVSRPRR